MICLPTSSYAIVRQIEGRGKPIGILIVRRAAFSKAAKPKAARSDQFL
jgi:hypothetical protein